MYRLSNDYFCGLRDEIIINIALLITCLLVNTSRFSLYAKIMVSYIPNLQKEELHERHY